MKMKELEQKIRELERRIEELETTDLRRRMVDEARVKEMLFQAEHRRPLEGMIIDGRVVWIGGYDETQRR